MKTTHAYKWLIFLVLASGAILWPAVYNGLAFFSSDTPAYVRGADAAINAATGISSEWTPAAVHAAASNPKAQASMVAAAPSKSSNSLQEKFVLAGRSPYYGLLLYVGAVGGGFWPSIIVQSLLLVSAVALGLQACELTKLRDASTAVAVLCLTPAAWFSSYLMPDIFAGLTILACGVLIAAPSSEWRAAHVFWFCLLVFALLAHSSHLLLAGILFVLALLLRSLSSRKPSSLGLGIIGSALLVAVIGGWLFDYTVTRVVGKPPVRPPFLMARVIDDGPGYHYLRSKCPQAGFRVCDFVERLPADADVFLWSWDPRRGVFATADPETRRELSHEQYRFVWEVLKYQPLSQVLASTRNALRQLLTFGAKEFNYTDWDRENFSQKLPPEALRRVQETVAYRGAMPIAMLSLLGYVTTAIAMLYLVRALLRNRPTRLETDGTLRRLIVIVLMGVAANAVICGAMSSLHDRYQARVVWLLPLMAFTLCLGDRARTWHPSVSGNPKLVRGPGGT